jgi:bifunctional non-homologous end joining protein LigD
MAPTLVREPFHRDGWVYEEKVDGWRMLGYKDGERVHFVSRNGRDHTRRFADLAAAVAKLSARPLVLDGEVAIFDEQLRSRFDWLGEPDSGAVASPPLFMAFDLLSRDGRDLTGRPLRVRRAGWRTSSPTASWCSPCVGSRPMGCRRGSRLSSAGMRATSRRTRPAHTREGRRGGG